MTEMSDKSEAKTNDKPTTKPSRENSPVSIFLMVAMLVGLVYYTIDDPARTWYILLVLAGFGAVIFIHELGHFVAAKSVGIMVEAFAIGFGPVGIGVKRVSAGFQVSILPTLIPGKDGIGKLGFVIPTDKSVEGETEYQMRLIPLGGFVKMLGQEDVAADKPSDDPRAFGNKGVWQRAWVISAGVMMNMISGLIIFMVVFAQGVALPPAIVGGVAPGSPAEKAGLLAGDKVIAINDGEISENIGFMQLAVEGAFTDDGETLSLTVRRTDGTQEILKIEPEMNKQLGMKLMGVLRPSTLTVAALKEAKAVAELKSLGFEPGDTITHVNGQAISRYDELATVMEPKVGAANPGPLNLTVKRTGGSGTSLTSEISIPMELKVVDLSIKDIGNVLGMSPRLRADYVLEDSPAEAGGLKVGDIITRIDTISCPTRDELFDYVKSHGDKQIEFTVLRKKGDSHIEEVLTITPKKQSKKWYQVFGSEENLAKIGIVHFPGDTDHPIVAEYKPIVKESKEGDKKSPAEMPQGATIVSIGGNDVANWDDIISELVALKGKDVAVVYHGPGSSEQKTITLSVPEEGDDWIGFAYRPNLKSLDVLQLEPLNEVFQGANWKENLSMGTDMTYSFVAQTYLMIRGMITGTVSPKAASGPVGILKMSYDVVSKKSNTYYFYFMAMISICIAVFNFLPLPVLDGGLFVLLMIEKIKGSPVSIKVQEIITYLGLIMILTFVLFVTFHDIKRIMGL